MRRAERLKRGKGGYRALLRVWLLLVGGVFALASVAVAQTPQFDLLKVGDKSLNDDLATAFNLPLIVKNSPDLAESVWRRLVETERLRLVQLIRGHGYLEGDVMLEGGTPPDGGNGLPTLFFRPKPGPLYRIGTVEFEGLPAGSAQSLKEQIYYQMRSVTGRAARGDTLAKLEQQILWLLKSSSYARATIAERHITPDPDNNLALVTIRAELGHSAKFGETRYSGLRQLQREDLAALQPYSTGQFFDTSKLDALYAALRAEPLIRDVRIHTVEAGDAKGHIDIDVSIDEQPIDRGGHDPAQPYVLIWVGVALGMLALRELLLAANWRAASAATTMVSVIACLTVMAALVYLGLGFVALALQP